jgi:hypothetical protein
VYERVRVRERGVSVESDALGSCIPGMRERASVFVLVLIDDVAQYTETMELLSIPF